MFKALKALKAWLADVECSDDCEVDCKFCGLHVDTYQKYEGVKKNG
jgi:hypothetical protein